MYLRNAHLGRHREHRRRPDHGPFSRLNTPQACTQHRRLDDTLPGPADFAPVNEASPLQNRRQVYLSLKVGRPAAPSSTLVDGAYF